MANWFICVDQEVSGPYATEQVVTQIADGAVPTDALVWAKPQTDWVTAKYWLDNRDQMLESMVTSVPEQMWHYAHSGDTFGPMSRPDLIEALSGVDRKSEILVWTKGMKNWVEIFEFHDLLEDLGCNRREHPRAPAEGQVIIKNDEKNLIGQLASISQGGLGIRGVGAYLNIGDNCHVEIKSDLLRSNISATATVQYISEGDFVGLKFQQIHLEHQNLIIDYVKGYDRQEAA